MSSELCTDAEFLRRASLDVTGTLRLPGDVGRFLADKSPHKRARQIDSLLASPGHSAWQIFSECVTDLNGEFSRQWWDWIYLRIAKNEPYDKLAAGIILAISRRAPGQSYKDYALEMASYLRRDRRADFAQRETMPWFWARKNVQKPEDRALSFAHAFLGVRIECAECHKHPFDERTTTDYVQFQQFFKHVRYDSNIRCDDDVSFVTATKEVRAAVGGGSEMRMRNEQGAEIQRRIEAGDPIGDRNRPDYALTAFGKPVREMNCDCERATVPTLLQTLYTRNDPEMLARLESPREDASEWIT